ncbi:MAG TPA: hypothetical protein VGR25_12200 [bacterium]|nr:hypothetical protein [bacterium]
MAGAGFILIGSVRAVRDGEVGFPIIGAIIATVGAVLLRRGLVEVRREKRLRRVRVPTEATVTAVLETNEGKSGYLNPDEAVIWEEGQTARVLVDPERPSDSVWFGDTTEQLDEV